MNIDKIIIIPDTDNFTPSMKVNSISIELIAFAPRNITATIEIVIRMTFWQTRASV
jgi:hypothetical protein